MNEGVRRSQKFEVAASAGGASTIKSALRPKFLENSLLVVAGLPAHAPLYYQLPRWANALDQ